MIITVTTEGERERERRGEKRERKKKKLGSKAISLSARVITCAKSHPQTGLAE